MLKAVMTAFEPGTGTIVKLLNSLMVNWFISFNFGYCRNFYFEIQGSKYYRFIFTKIEV